MVKASIRTVLLLLAAPFSPVVRLYCWWLPLNLGNRGKVVILPDSMAVFMAFATVAFIVPFGAFRWLNAEQAIVGAMIALVALPILLTNVVLVATDGVKVFRVLAVFPYWVHRVPAGATFDMYESFDDVAPTGVAFEAEAYGNDPLHLGTSTSAAALYEHLAARLEQAGWQRVAFGLQSPSAWTTTL